MTACLNAMRVLTDPADTGAVCLAMPQDVEGEAYDYPVHFLQKAGVAPGSPPGGGEPAAAGSGCDQAGQKSYSYLRRRCALQRGRGCPAKVGGDL